MEKYKITIQKTARYFTIGKLDNKTKSIWIIIHGYGQLANYFLRKFDVLDDGSTFIAAPEAVSKFYLTGFSGRVGATWMTKEARELEILDNFEYLKLFFNKLTSGINLENIQVNILGFSQGTQTASRWILNSNIRINNLILWGGSLPSDSDYKIYEKRLSSFKLHLVIGENDEFISSENVKNEVDKLKKNNVKFTFHSYKGKHDIDKMMLKQLVI